ncbi:MAG: SAM-dependent methyltransferase [Bacteroidetes bacterium]|nr:MAG: SAM-dependent methyltransferase [Bacteroidota bacterium]
MSQRIIDDYGWQSTEAPHSCNYITPEILAIISKLNVQRILDLGSGNGALCQQLQKSGYDAVGVEIDKKGIEIARKAYQEVPFYCYGVGDDPELLLEKEQPFEAVISTEVIEHLFTPHTLIRYAKAVLQDRGYLILSTPYHGYIKNMAISVLNKWDFHFTALRPGGHIKFFSRRTLSQLLNQNGFEVIDFSGVGRIPYLWKSMILITRKK